ncbi:hypothetical protein NDU88_000698 [Pleurodeles waltl]|uniref:Uncharacterized protein n=1 Tax=Pleurodeles waltl TaxID=8319 RepID=A0AAV7NBB4_PLEWA|nr:hypothetical protein NDU88_000698 [Pleurodeles waltl]
MLLVGREQLLPEPVHREVLPAAITGAPLGDQTRLRAPSQAPINDVSFRSLSGAQEQQPVLPLTPDPHGAEATCLTDSVAWSRRPGACPPPDTGAVHS